MRDAIPYVLKGCFQGGEGVDASFFSIVLPSRTRLSSPLGRCQGNWVSINRVQYRKFFHFSKIPKFFLMYGQVLSPAGAFPSHLDIILQDHLCMV